MRAEIHKKDHIKKLGNYVNSVEVGDIPKNRGLELLRFDGNKIVDISELDQIYVKFKNSYFTFHSIPVRGSQLVSMRWKDRKKLINDNGTIRLKTNEEILKEDSDVKETAKSNKIRNAIKKEYASELDYKIKRDKAIWATIDYLLNGNTRSVPFVRKQLNKIKNILGIE